jgi:hypothetical protein
MPLNHQFVWRAPNRNAVQHLGNERSGPIDRATAPPQLVEVTPDISIRSL